MHMEEFPAQPSSRKELDNISTNILKGNGKKLSLPLFSLQFLDMDILFQGLMTTFFSLVVFLNINKNLKIVAFTRMFGLLTLIPIVGRSCNFLGQQLGTERVMQPVLITNFILYRVVLMIQKKLYQKFLGLIQMKRKGNGEVRKCRVDSIIKLQYAKVFKAEITCLYLEVEMPSLK